MTGGRPDLGGLRIDERARADSGRGRRPAVAVAVLALAALAAWLAWLAWPRPALVEVAPARAAAAGASGAATVLNASGYVTPRRRATVAAKITGRVVAMLVEEGMAVEAGQVLARLDPSDAERRLASARAELDVARASIADLEVQLADAERTARRLDGLRQERVASAEDADRADALAASLRARLGLGREQVRAARARLGEAEQDLENCVVRAPFAGIAVSKDAQVGEMVSPISAGGGFTRTGIATIVDMTSLEIEVDVNEAYIAKVGPGQAVEAALDAWPDWRIPARVRTVIPTADRQKATVKVRIAFDALDPRILPDMGVKVAFLRPAEAAAAGAGEGGVVAVVPAAAVRQDGGQAVVLVVRDGRLERRAVRVGARQGGEVEVTAGLRGGEQVVVAGPDRLGDGQRVRVGPGGGGDRGAAGGEG